MTPAPLSTTCTKAFRRWRKTCIGTYIWKTTSCSQEPFSKGGPPLGRKRKPLASTAQNTGSAAEGKCSRTSRRGVCALQKQPLAGPHRRKAQPPESNCVKALRRNLRLRSPTPHPLLKARVTTRNGLFFTIGFSTPFTSPSSPSTPSYTNHAGVV